MRRAAALFALPALAVANGVSLSEFHPSVSGLSSSCEALYTSDLPGCQPSDFTSKHCSSSCLSTLSTVTGVIHQVCGNEHLQGTNLISAFLAGDGTQQICPNAPGNSASSYSSSPSSSAQQSSQSTSTQAVASSSAFQTSASSSPSTSSAASAAGSTTSSAPSTSVVTSSGIAIDSTGSPTVSATTAPSSTSASNGANSQQDISHGGSPFDLSGSVNAADRHAARMIPSITAALLVALLGSLAI